MTKQTKKSPFVLFKDGILLKKPVKFDKNETPIWLLIHWLAHDDDSINKVNALNKVLYYVKDEAAWSYFVDVVPKGSKWIKWIKKVVITKERQKHLTELTEQYNISELEAIEILNVMEEK